MHAPLSFGTRHRASAAAPWLFVALVLLAASCARSGNGRSAPAAGDLPRAFEPTAEEQSCWKDSECTLVDDCCGCAAGGLRMSVRQDRLTGLEERSAAACEQRTCPNQPSQHRSCTATAARCVGGRCIPAL